MISLDERQIELRAEMAQLLLEIAPAHDRMKESCIFNDIKLLAILSLTVSAVMFLSAMHSPVILSVSIAGMIFSILLSFLDRLSLSANVSRIEHLFDSFVTACNRR